MCPVRRNQGLGPSPHQQLCTPMACPEHLHHPPLSPPQPIDYDGFRLFMKTYLEADVPEELCQHLFTSFKRKICQASPETQHQSPGVSQLNTLGEPTLSLPARQAHCGMAACWAYSCVAPQGSRLRSDTCSRWHWGQHTTQICPIQQMGLQGLCIALRRKELSLGWGNPWAIIALIPPFPLHIQSPSHLI